MVHVNFWQIHRVSKQQYSSSSFKHGKSIHPEIKSDLINRANKLQTTQIHKPNALKHIKQHASNKNYHEQKISNPDISCNIQPFQANYSSLESTSQELHMA